MSQKRWFSTQKRLATPATAFQTYAHKAALRSHKDSFPCPYDSNILNNNKRGPVKGLFFFSYLKGKAEFEKTKIQNDGARIVYLRPLPGLAF